MKAEDLRIGNLLICGLTKSLLKVIEIKEDGFTTFVIDRSKFPLPDGWFAEPIPLTEEILLKCGFEINGKYYRSKYIQDSIKLIYDFNQRVLYFKYKGEFSPMIQIPRAIESLHELQNLYYAFTGKELEVCL